MTVTISGIVLPSARNPWECVRRARDTASKPGNTIFLGVRQLLDHFLLQAQACHEGSTGSLLKLTNAAGHG